MEATMALARASMAGLKGAGAWAAAERETEIDRTAARRE